MSQQDAHRHRSAFHTNPVDAALAHWSQPRTPRTPAIARAVRAEHIRQAVRGALAQLAQRQTRPNGPRPRNTRWLNLDRSR